MVLSELALNFLLFFLIFEPIFVDLDKSGYSFSSAFDMGSLSEGESSDTYTEMSAGSLSSDLATFSVVKITNTSGDDRGKIIAQNNKQTTLAHEFENKFIPTMKRIYPF